jgi:3-dehydroquinate synthase
MRHLRVSIPGSAMSRYSIQVGPGILEGLPGIIAKHISGGRVYIISDRTVSRLYGSRLLRDLEPVVPGAALIDFAPGEGSKNVRVWEALVSEVLRGGIGRDGLIVALGGGVVGDLAGFVAATVLRGVKLLQVPTTLLAQVDSSIGGKTGIDHAVGKNLIGAFHQPAGVIIDPTVLRTLPTRVFRAGLAEVIKIGVALDRSMLVALELERTAIRRRDPRALSRLIARAVSLKAAVVEADERESDLRKSLNLGHTIGHAVEVAAALAIPHGECVAIGLAAESRIAVRMGLLKARDEERILGLLRGFDLPIRMPPIRRKVAFLAAMRADKKSRQGTTEFVLPVAYGRCAIGVAVPAEVIASVTGVHV